MKRNTLKNIAGFTLIEMLIGVVISSIMMAAMYTTYSVVNNSYGQVVDKAKISRSGRDIVEMLMRDIRMAGFKYILGTNTFTVGTETHSYPTRTYLEFKSGRNDLGSLFSKSDSHDPIIIVKSELGYTRAEIGAATSPPAKHDSQDLCCDKIHIVYDDFNQNDTTQPYKRYKTTYYALPKTDGGDARYAVYKTFESWIQVLGDATGEWRSDCNECYHEQKVRDHVVDMEFIPFDIEGRKINPLEATSENELEANRQKIYDIRVVDVRLTFRSKKEFFRTDKARPVKGISNRTDTRIADKYLRDSVVVTIHTRNIGDGI
jgi:prepilin-type N-terminal cleavage/methylation domain-containing protein